MQKFVTRFTNTGVSAALFLFDILGAEMIFVTSIYALYATYDRHSNEHPLISVFYFRISVFSLRQLF